MARPALLISDEPERNPDRLRFGFPSYAQTIVDLVSLSDNRTPLVIAIYGQWGAGKTTLMQAVLQSRNLTDERPGHRRCRSVQFDAWQTRDDESVLTALVEEVFRTIRQNGFDCPEQELVEFRRRYGGAKALGPIARYLLAEGEVELLANPEYEAQRSRLPYLSTFRRFLDDLIGLYVEGKLPAPGATVDDRKAALVIFIDDLDRCSPRKVVEAFSGLKLFLDRPGCVFVLAMDQERVESAIRLAYADRTDSEQTYEADKFLDKVIDVSFTLPPLKPEEAGQYLQDWCQGIPALKTYSGPIVESLNRNPRRIKRLVNELNLTLALADAAGVGISEEHAVAFTVLKYAFREYHRQLEAQPDLPERVEQAVARLEAAGGAKIDELDLRSAPMQHALSGLSIEAPIVTNPALRTIVRSLPKDRSVVLSYLALSRTATFKENELEVRRPEVRVDGGFARVAAGRFLYGPDKQPMTIDYDYEIGVFPVTNREYQEFISANPNHRAPGVEADWAEGYNWRNRRYPEGKEHHPVVLVAREDALAYCAWRTRTDKDGFVWRLPTEQEWEKAARGPDGNVFPWGNEMDKTKCNCRESGIGGTTPVTKYGNGVSYYGCYDMAGNVWEWCEEEPPQTDPQAPRILRGGSWDDEAEFVRSDYRYPQYPSNVYINVGFRVVRVRRPAPAGAEAGPRPA